ncbi:MAG TPA: trigger factor [Planctomycetaceae bacterium]|nr:trigger factor [Planctomycetaceae bacterium]
MSDEQSAVATMDAPEKYKMSLNVDIQNVGPCRKHVRVTVPRKDLDHFRNDALSEVGGSAAVPGFRVGHVPKQLVERRFKKEISDQVRQRVLLTSLEQLADENSLDPINEPDFDIESLVLPDDGDFQYEFDVEVRPEFDLPNYTGLKIQRPTKEVSDADVAEYQGRFLEQYATPTAKDEPAAKGDLVTVDIEFLQGDTLLKKMSDLTVQLKPRLQFPDGEISGFDTLMAGATPGAVKTTDLTISSEAETIEKRGEKVTARFTVTAVKQRHTPELNKDFLDRLGMESEDDLQDQIRSMLHRQITFEQRQSTRKQVLDKITESATWELPEELVRKQVENALRREILEMQQAGFTTQQIRARENELRQKSISTTRQALKEHFVLDKIATKENIEVTPPDIESEIQMMALQRGENPRRVRARLQKSGVIENLEAQVRERKAVDFILKSAVYEDVPYEPKKEDDLEAVGIAICSTAATTDLTEADDTEE